MSATTVSTKIIVDVGLVAAGEVLLVKYTGMPDHQRGWFLPHVMLAEREDPAARAEGLLAEQLGIEAGPGRISHIESFVGNDGTWHLPIHFHVRLEAKPAIEPSDAVARHGWFPLDALPPRGEVAHHGWALDNLARMLEG